MRLNRSNYVRLNTIPKASGFRRISIYIRHPNNIIFQLHLSLNIFLIEAANNRTIRICWQKRREIERIALERPLTNKEKEKIKSLNHKTTGIFNDIWEGYKRGAIAN